MKKVRSVAAAAVAAALLAACSGGGSSTPSPVSTAPANTIVTPSISIVGVGDSLTAGYQSDGLLGVPVVPNPVAGSPFQPGVPATQENGWWALLWSQANGGAAVGNAANSPLPLISGPGLGTVLVPNAALSPTAIVSGAGATCAGLNALAYSYATALQTRANPTTTPFDLGIPGQNVHEAYYQTGPEVPCSIPATATTQFAGLIALLGGGGGESGTFYPILGNFLQGTTQVGAAASLHTKYATVWLGSNDLLKFTFSLGTLPATSASAMQADLVTIIRALQGAGEKVAIANLVTVLDAAYFVPQPALQTVLVQDATATATASALAQGAPAGTAAAIGAAAGAQVATAYTAVVAPALLATYGVGSGGYVTISGISKILTSLLTPGNPPYTLGGGDFVPDALAAQVSALNVAYNGSIAAAANQTGAALVNVNTAFAQLVAHPGTTVPGQCCTMQFGGGFFSLDGIHPSNTGYAVLANLFIAQFNTSFGTTIPLVNVNTVFATDPFRPH